MLVNAGQRLLSGCCNSAAFAERGADQRVHAQFIERAPERGALQSAAGEPMASQRVRQGGKDGGSVRPTRSCNWSSLNR